MKIIISLSIILFFAANTSLLIAQNNDDVTAYSIPTGAKKIGPLTTRRPNQVEYVYYVIGINGTTKNLIARERYINDFLIKRELFKDKKKHGVQREWYINGHLKSESTWRNGVMDGNFRHWDEQGLLVAQYEISHGTGTAKIYNSDGILISEEAFKDNYNDGLRMELLMPEDIRSLIWFKSGQRIGVGYGFYHGGDRLRTIIFQSDTGSLHGPYVEFSVGGTIVEEKYFVRGLEVTEDQYAQAVIKDPTLPPYHQDATKYKEFVTPEVKALLEKYRTMPRVKIPLEFDAQGNPIPAPVTGTAH